MTGPVKGLKSKKRQRSYCCSPLDQAEIRARLDEANKSRVGDDRMNISQFVLACALHDDDRDKAPREAYGQPLVLLQAQQRDIFRAVRHLDRCCKVLLDNNPDKLDMSLLEALAFLVGARKAELQQAQQAHREKPE